MIIGVNTLAHTVRGSHHSQMEEDQNLHMELTVAAPMQSVYIALTTEKGLRGWWTEHADVATEVGGTHRLRFPDAEFEVQMEIVELSPFHRVHWRCIACRHPASSGWSDLADWLETELVFVIRPAPDGETDLHVAHQGMGPSKESLERTSQGWQHYLERSLRDYVEDGEGDPCR
jgi:uncharacterized protein YndB with AHSA1/START domain